MDKKEEYLGCGYALLLLALTGASVMLMWNYGLAKAFDLERINFWQALILDGFVSYVFPHTSIKDTGYTLTEQVNNAFGKAIVYAAIIFIASLFL
ncbi:hypothetical protein [Jeotgalibaca porci]|uniref:hypothetical protein n=1 Tax=Jeotgalibaca porci TaxID=1868793 RepID=UPI0035A05A07